MYLRCSRCHEPTWIRSLVPGLVERAVACQDCGHEHDLARVSDLGDTAKKQYGTATRFADANNVDLPTAYSVLLGLMTLDDARGVDAAKQDLTRREAAAKATPDVAPEAAAIRLPRKRRTRPPRRSAGAEPALTVHVEREMAEQRRQLTWGQLALLLVLATLTLGLSGRHAYLTWRAMVDDARNAQRSTAASEKALENAELKALTEARGSRRLAAELQSSVERDADGHVTRIVGSGPMQVLEAYCAAVSDIHPREPLEIAEASPPSPNERYGVFRDFSRLETNRAIRISRIDGQNRWAAGNGTRPVPTRDAPNPSRTILSAAAKPSR